MFENRSKVLLILPQDVLDRARVTAAKVTITLNLPVSVQIVLRAVIEEGLKHDGDRALVANIEGQALAVRRIRRLARRGGGAVVERENLRRRLDGSGPRRRGA
jgi:cobalamin-dependent methionine synthase I